MPVSGISVAPLLALPRPAKRLAVLALDLVLSIFSVWSAFYLRIGQTGLPQYQQIYAYLLAPVLVVPIFVRLGLYRPFSATRAWLR